MKELVKPSLTEKDYEENEEKDVAGYCDLDGCSNICFHGDCQPYSSDDESGDILF